MTKQKDNTSEVVLSVNNISKNFLLPHEKMVSIKSSIVNIFKPKDRTIEVQHALKDISFKIEKGEFFGILGRNGSGKSTLLKILAEIYQPTSGTIQKTGKLVPFIELGVGFNPELTGRENVYLNGALLGFSRAEIDEKYDDIVEFAELEEFMDQKLKNYSSGMQVRLAFSVATRSEADILLVDEVLAVGDADFQRKCYDYFKSLKKSGKTVIFVTHDMSAVREYCDRAILIKDGLIAHENTADVIANEYLKLFNENNSSSLSAVDTKRWGNGQVRVSNLDVDTSDDKISLSISIQSDKRGAENYVVGYKLYDSEGKLVMGGNNLNAKNGKKLFLEPDSKQDICFLINNVLGNGTFTLSTTARLGDGVTICDQWDNAAEIKVTKSESYYPIIAPADVSVD
ncbi:ABC transporter ATP-binding protein [Candidatus Saccharibacteria bacterium]|nr:ABC transporter ATP-binding protein [Candidatus Saccharibacteria bacterium]